MSGRPDYEIKHDFETTVAFFVESIHAWVSHEPELISKKFTLLGHSMGGMFAGYYALAHPECVNQLIFMSSVGLTNTPDWAKVPNVRQNIQSSCLAIYGAEFAERMMSESTLTPFDMYRIAGRRFGHAGIKSGMMRRLDKGVLSEEQIEHLTTYVYQMMVRKKSSEKMLSKIMRPFVYMPQSLEDRLHSLKAHDISMAFMYGEFDWVNRNVGDRLIESG